MARCADCREPIAMLMWCGCVDRKPVAALAQLIGIYLREDNDGHFVGRDGDREGFELTAGWESRIAERVLEFLSRYAQDQARRAEMREAEARQ